MRKFLSTLLLIAGVTMCYAQTMVHDATPVTYKSPAALIKEYEKLKTTVADVKKGAKPANWIKLGKNLYDSYETPFRGLYVGMTEAEAKEVLKEQKVVSQATETIGKSVYNVVKYDNKTLYYNDAGKIAMWTITKPVLENVDMLKECYDAFKTASSKDEKGSNKDQIKQYVQRVNNYILNDAMAQYTFGNYAKASELFVQSVECQRSAILDTLDTLVLYYAAYTADLGGNYAEAIPLYQDCIECQYFQNGDAFSRMSECYRNINDLENSKKTLLEGVKMFPDNQNILISLISIYMESDEDPEQLLSYIRSAQENDATNASLIYAEGNVQKKLNNKEAAIECFKRCIEVDPTYSFAHYSIGADFYDKAVDLQIAARDENDDDKYLKITNEMEACLEQAIDPFEKTFSIDSTPADLKVAVAEYLKNIYYRLQSKNATYEEKYSFYEKYVNEHQADKK